MGLRVFKRIGCSGEYLKSRRRLRQEAAENFMRSFIIFWLLCSRSIIEVIKSKENDEEGM
jgi:hypothetical protein